MIMLSPWTLCFARSAVRKRKGSVVVGVTPPILQKITSCITPKSWLLSKSEEGIVPRQNRDSLYFKSYSSKSRPLNAPY